MFWWRSKIDPFRLKSTLDQKSKLWWSNQNFKVNFSVVKDETLKSIFQDKVNWWGIKFPLSYYFLEVHLKSTQKEKSTLKPCQQIATSSPRVINLKVPHHHTFSKRSYSWFRRLSKSIPSIDTFSYLGQFNNFLLFLINWKDVIHLRQVIWNEIFGM